MTATCRLSWDSYQKNISSGLSTLQHNGEFVDMTLATAGHLVKVHKNLLALASPYIKAMIQTTPCQHPVIFLSNINDDILGLILEYVYTGEVQMATQKMEPFFKACRDLHIIGIQNVAPPRLGNRVRSPNISKVNDLLDKSSEMIPRNTDTGNIYFNKEMEMKRRVANTSRRSNIRKNAAGISDKRCKLTDQTVIDRDNEIIPNNADQLSNCQSNDAINSEGEASASSDNFLTYRDTVAMTVDEEQTYKANSGFSELIDNNGSQPTIQSSFQVTDLEASVFNESPKRQQVLDKHIHNDSNPKVTENTDEIKLLPKSTEDFEHRIGAHVIDTVESTSKITQKEQAQDSMAGLKLIPALCLNQSHTSNDITMTDNETVYVKDTNLKTDNIILETETYSYNNENTKDGIDMEQNVTAENIDTIHIIKLNCNDYNNLLGDINVGTIQEYKETDIEKSTKKLKSATNAHIESKANYSVNVELPGGSKGPPKITIMSGAIQNKPVPPLDMEDHNTESDLELHVESKAQSLQSLVNSGSAPLYMVNGKSKLQMIFNRFIYCIHHTSQRNKRWRWRCIDYRHKRCLAYVDTVGDLIVDRKNAHSHQFHDKKVFDCGSRRRVFSSLQEIQELVGKPLDKLHNADLGILNRH